MLKSLIFTLFGLMTVSAHAQTYNICYGTVKQAFWSSDREAQVICSQDSSKYFVDCMARIGYGPRPILATSAAKQCNPRINLANDYRPDYNQSNSCPAKLQVNTRMPQDYAIRVCEWDDSPLMVNCITDLTRHARFYFTHSVQYCAFAAAEYRPKVPEFVQCVIDRSKRGYDVYSSVADCDNLIVTGRPLYSVPRTDRRPQPQQPQPKQPQQPQQPQQPPVQPYPNVQPNPNVPAQPDPKTPDPSVLNPEKQPNGTGRKVPTPVDIKIEENQNPTVKDKSLDTGSTENSESLPM